MTLPRLQDFVKPPPGPEMGYLIPEPLLPAGAARGTMAIWDPSVGAPTTWLLALEAFNEAQDTLGVISLTALAPEVLRQEGVRLGTDRDWILLGTWFLGMLFVSMSRPFKAVSSRDDGSVRGYEFSLPGEEPFALMDVTGFGGRFEVPLETLRQMCALRFLLDVGVDAAAPRSNELFALWTANREEPLEIDMRQVG